MAACKDKNRWADSILREVYLGYLAPKRLEAPWLGLAVNGGAGVLNALWSWVLIQQGKKLRFPALVAGGRHLLTEVLTLGGVLAGVALAAVTGLLILDPLLAALVAINIL